MAGKRLKEREKTNPPQYAKKKGEEKKGKRERGKRKARVSFFLPFIDCSSDKWL